MTNITASFHILIFSLYLENSANFHAFNSIFYSCCMQGLPHFDTKFIFLHPILYPSLLL